MATRFPRMDAYLAQLPHGIHSYPQCRSKASLIRNMEESRHFEAQSGELPEPCYELLKNPPPNSAWSPSVPFIALMLAFADVHFPGDDERFAGWIYDLSAALFAKPLYRFLMYVAAPKMFINGSANRWSQFHQGTEMNVVDRGDKWAVFRINWPPYLFDAVAMRSVSTSIAAAIAAAGGKSVQDELVEIASEQGSFRISWR